MTACDANKKPEALNILFCRRKLQESMFIRKGALLERGFMLSTTVNSGGFIGEGG